MKKLHNTNYMVRFIEREWIKGFMADYINKGLKTKINGVITTVYPYTNTDAVLDNEGNTLTERLEGLSSSNVTDEEKATWNAKSDFSGSYNDLTDKPDIPDVSEFALSSHVQDASTITAGTFAGDVVAPASTDYTTMMLRNSILTATDSGANVLVSYPNGSLVFVYKIE